MQCRGTYSCIRECWSFWCVCVCNIHTQQYYGVEVRGRNMLYKIYVRWYSYTPPPPLTIKCLYVVVEWTKTCRSYMMTEDVERMKMGELWWDIGGLSTSVFAHHAGDTTTTAVFLARRRNICYCLLLKRHYKLWFRWRCALFVYGDDVGDARFGKDIYLKKVHKVVIL